MQSFALATGSAAAVSASRAVPLVLVADDDEDILTLVALRFRRSGLEVILARDGEEALELIQTRAPDAAVLDIAMPKLTGLEITLIATVLALTVLHYRSAIVAHDIVADSISDRSNSHARRRTWLANARP